MIVPYYSVGRKEQEVDSTSLRLPYNTLTGGSTLMRSSFEQGFRSIVPTGDEVKEIALNVAEPYSWWMDYQSNKIRALTKRPEFDTSSLTVDRGHTWLLEQYTLQGLQNLSWSVSGETYEMRNVVPYRESDLIPMSTLPSTSIETWSAQQYGRMAPVVSEFSLANFLGELREGLRLLPQLQTRAKRAKAAGDAYLSVEFGWKPLLNDLHGLAESILQASFGLYRPYGASHRRRERPTIHAFSTGDVGVGNLSARVGHLGNPAGYNPYSATSISWSSIGAIGTATNTFQSEMKQWVEGEFVYIPKAGFDPSSFLDRYETLVSVDLTPAVLWELAPWSWLVDWFAHIGQSIASMEAGLSNRILSTYFYGMEDSSSTTTGTVRVTGNQSGRIYNGPRVMTTTIRRRRRRRIRANPFGYGGSSSTMLNLQQIGILNALGLTKAR
jgi:hypothetical protein